MREHREEEHEGHQREGDGEARGPVVAREEDERRRHRGASADVRQLPREGRRDQLALRRAAEELELQDDGERMTRQPPAVARSGEEEDGTSGQSRTPKASAEPMTCCTLLRIERERRGLQVQARTHTHMHPNT